MASGLTDYRRLFVQTICQLIKESPYSYALSEVHEQEFTTHMEIVLLQPYQWTKSATDTGQVVRLSIRIEAKED